MVVPHSLLVCPQGLQLPGGSHPPAFGECWGPGREAPRQLKHHPGLERRVQSPPGVVYSTEVRMGRCWPGCWTPEASKEHPKLERKVPPFYKREVAQGWWVWVSCGDMVEGLEKVASGCLSPGGGAGKWEGSGLQSQEGKAQSC